jgi:dethiobiotin synthetase
MAPAIILVTGTGTEIGKTWVAAALARELRSRGRRVVARKPAQSFEPGDDTAGRTDAQVLGAATGEDPEAVCPPARWYPVPLAPPMAARALGLPDFTIADLIAELGRAGTDRADRPAVAPARDAPVAEAPVAEAPVAGEEVLLVETAGGVRSPLADDGDTVAFAATLDPAAVVLVADPGLGTINAVRLSVDALTGAAGGSGRPIPVVVFLNRFVTTDPLHTGNLAWLHDRDGLRCMTTISDLADVLDRPGIEAGAGRPALQ